MHALLYAYKHTHLSTEVNNTLLSFSFDSKCISLHLVYLVFFFTNLYIYIYHSIIRKQKRVVTNTHSRIHDFYFAPLLKSSYNDVHTYSDIIQ